MDEPSDGDLVGVARFVDRLKAYGLSIVAATGARLRVANPLSSSLFEDIVHRGGRYVTAWGYELGELGDETGTARRLAYLLGAPSRPQAVR